MLIARVIAEEIYLRISQIMRSKRNEKILSVEGMRNFFSRFVDIETPAAGSHPLSFI